MPSTFEVLEQPNIEAPVRKEKLKRSPQLPEKNSKRRNLLLLLLLFAIPAATYGFALWMAGPVEFQMGDAWASLYLLFGQCVSLVLLLPPVFGLIRDGACLPRTSTALAIFFMLFGFAFLEFGPKPRLAPATTSVVETPKALEAPKAEIVAASQPTEVPIPVEPTAEIKKDWDLILFPVFAIGEKRMLILFPLHVQYEKKDGSKVFWLLPYYSRTYGDGSKTTFMFPFYFKKHSA